MCDVTKKDHPLALDAFSKWNLYFRVQHLAHRHSDRSLVFRTMKFGIRSIETLCGRIQTCISLAVTAQQLKFTERCDKHTIEDDQLCIQEIKRALFVFAKLNPGLNYVQGMNEIYAPLYYVFKTNEHGEYGERGGFGSIDHAEADAFFCFVDLMSEFRDNFCKQLVRPPCLKCGGDIALIQDNSSSGVRATISKFSNLLLNVDPVLWDHLKFKTQVRLGRLKV